MHKSNLWEKDFGKGKMRLVILKTMLKPNQKVEKVARFSLDEVMTKYSFFSSSRNILLNKCVLVTIKSVIVVYLPRNEPRILFLFILAYKKTSNTSLWILDKIKQPYNSVCN